LFAPPRKELDCEYMPPAAMNEKQCRYTGWMMSYEEVQVASK
jgi:hypothetical protein